LFENLIVYRSLVIYYRKNVPKADEQILNQNKTTQQQPLTLNFIFLAQLKHFLKMM